MTPKEKANELIEIFKNETDGIAAYNYDNVNIQCALICVDEIIQTIGRLKAITPMFGGRPFYSDINNEEIKNYWKEVKQEIKNMK